VGKESRLRNPKPVSRTEYANGDRKLYDRDAMPSGTDSDIWDLALYFEQAQEKEGLDTDGRPIIYTELYHRVSKDPDLTQLLRTDTSLTARPRVTDGIYGTDDKIVAFIKSMIDTYFLLNTSDYINVHEFTSKSKFEYIKKYLEETYKREQLITTGIRIRQQDTEVKPSRRSEEEKETFQIMHRPRSEEESRSRIASWKKERG
jgi:hypothetical protein